MAEHEGSFERASGEAIAALGGSPAEVALDGWADPAGAAAGLGGLAEKGAALLRAAGELGGGEPGFAPAPAAPWWLRVSRGSAEVRACASLPAGAASCETRRVTRVVVDSAPLPEGDGASVARVWLNLERLEGATGGLGAKVLVAEAWARDEAAAVGRVRAFAGRLARALSVPASLPAGGAAAEAEGEDGAAEALPASVLARFTLRGEGPRLVLRDLASRGPREKMGIHLGVGLAFAALAAAAWVQLARSAGAAGAFASGSIAWLGGAALLTLAAVAFLGVARFAQRYGAVSAPVAAFGAGKLIVAPWVSRSGAVGLDLEGRFGAAIDLAEVSGVSVQERDGKHAIEAATEHGPIDVLITEDPAIAGYFAAALGRVAADLRPAGARTAKQRARARAAAAAG